MTVPHAASAAAALRGTEGARAERKLALLLCAPAVAVMLAVAAFPIAYAVWLSLHRADLRAPDAYAFIGLENYVTVLSSAIWWEAFGVTLGITIVSSALELALGLALALVMHRTLVARDWVRTITLIPYAIVTVVAAFSWRYAFTQYTGWLAGDSAPLVDRWASLGIIVFAEVWKTTPFMALLLLAGLVQVPKDVLDAAALDGATAWQRLTRITLPLMKPVIFVALLFRTMDAFRIFDHIYVLTNGANGTASVSIIAYDNLMKGLNLGIGSTLSVLIVMSIVGIALVLVALFGRSAVAGGASDA